MSDLFIQGLSPSEWIRFVRHDESSHTYFSIEASIEGERVLNHEVIFEPARAFLAGLERFDAHRSSTHSITGSEDFSFSIEPDGSSGQAWIAFTLSRILFTHSSKTGRLRDGFISLRGGFALDGERVSSTIKGFHELLR